MHTDDCFSPFDLLESPDIVIRTENLDFEVHKRVLSTSSSLSNSATHYTNDGSPVPVLLVPEGSEVMSRVVKFIYNRKAFTILDKGDTTTMSIKNVSTLCIDICEAAEKVSCHNPFESRVSAETNIVRVVRHLSASRDSYSLDPLTHSPPVRL